MLMLTRTVLAAVGCGIVAVTAEVAADSGTAIEAGRSYRIESKVLGETRVIDVCLPDGYAAETAARYPVLYVLDGEIAGDPACSIARFYERTSQLPPLIVVGVRNTSRTRDLTPAPASGFKAPPEAEGSGGAGPFLDFLAGELVPWVEREYRIAPMRVLAGHSLGGLFALYALAARPEVFGGYIVMEPAVWWNNRQELEAARQALGKPALRRKRIIMINAESLSADSLHWGGIAPMVRRLSVAGETHASLAMAGLMTGLRSLFADFRPAEWLPGTRPIAMLASYDTLASRVGYDVPVPAQAYAQVIRMSIYSRYFEDAERGLGRMEAALGQSPESRELRGLLQEERAGPRPAGFIPLEIPARRPTPVQARAFLGRWESVQQPHMHEIHVRASGDTIVVHDRIELPNGGWFDADDPVVQVTADGTLEWGLPWFRGIAALLVLRGRVLEDGTLVVTRETRGWVPRGPGPDSNRVEKFRRVGS